MQYLFNHSIHTIMILKCEYSFKELYTCSTESQEIPINEDILIFQGEHLPGKNNKDVKFLEIQDCEMPQLPQNVGHTFENIERLHILNSNLKSLTKVDLKQFINLKEIFVSGSNIEFLPGDLFEFTKKMENIYFTSNNIKFIGTKIFDCITNLKAVSLTKNTNINCLYEKNNHHSDDEVITLKQLKEAITINCKPPMNEREMLGKYGRDPYEGKPKIKKNQAIKSISNF